MLQIIQAEEQNEMGTTDADKTRRRDLMEKLTTLLPEIATEVTNAMAAVGLHIPIFFTMLSSGETVVSFITPDDNITDKDWATGCDIACRILEDKIGFRTLIAREVACIGAGAQSTARTDAANHSPGLST